MKRSLVLAGLFLLAGFAIWLCRQFFRPFPLPSPPRTVSQVVKALAPGIQKRLESAFRQAGVSYPPDRVVLLAFKSERRLDLLAANRNSPFRFVHSWPILAASGTAGPKLKEGDRQVPEGFYRIELLNPNSRYHLSLRVNYPNADDIAQAREEGRDLSTLGGDIMIHGGAASIGCLAVGDSAAEELFVLGALTGLDNIRLIISPCDFRTGAQPRLPPGAPAWVPGLHARLRRELQSLPAQ